MGGSTKTALRHSRSNSAPYVDPALLKEQEEAIELYPQIQGTQWQQLEDWFVNERGLRLFYTTLFPPKDIQAQELRGIVVYIHGVNEHSRWFYHVFEHLCSQGFGVLAYDVISHGKSDCEVPHMRAHTENFKHMVEDTNAFITHAKDTLLPKLLDESLQAAHINIPMVLAGFSMGSLIASHTVLADKHHFDGIVLIAPAVGVEMTATLRIQSVFSAPAAALAPTARIVPAVNEKWVSRDEDYLKKFNADPLKAESMMTVRMGKELLVAMKTLQKNKSIEKPHSKFCSAPLLMLMGSNDKVTSRLSADAFFNRVATIDKEFQIFGGYYHSLFHEPEKEEILTFWSSWLKTRYPVLASARA